MEPPDGPDVHPNHVAYFKMQLKRAGKLKKDPEGFLKPVLSQCDLCWNQSCEECQGRAKAEAPNTL